MTDITTYRDLSVPLQIAIVLTWALTILTIIGVMMGGY